MKVYRLERNGYGPYCFNSMDVDGPELAELRHKLCATHDRTHPVAEQEISGYSQLDQFKRRCGCESMVKLRDWFGEFFQELLDAGFKVAVYESSEYAKSSRQVLFVPQGNPKYLTASEL